MKITKKHTAVITKQKRNVLMTIILSGMVILPLFAYYNMTVKGLFHVAYIEIFLTFVAIFLFFFARDVTDYKLFLKIALFTLAVLYVLFLFLIFNPSTSVSIFYWVFIIPLANYGLMGKKFGFLMTLFFCSLAVLFHHYSVKTPTAFNASPIFNAIGSLTFVWYIVHSYETSNAELIKSLGESSITDALTGLYNRKILADIFKEYTSENLLVSVIIDIDFFKRVNDTYGHDAGDRVLVSFSTDLTNFFNKTGYVIRLGGEEFCVVMPNIDVEKANKLLEIFLHQTGCKNIAYKEDNIKITFSAGMASFPQDGKNYLDLLNVADSRLYKAKEMGRNRIISV